VAGSLFSYIKLHILHLFASQQFLIENSMTLLGMHVIAIARHSTGHSTDDVLADYSMILNGSS